VEAHLANPVVIGHVVTDVDVRGDLDVIHTFPIRNGFTTNGMFETAPNVDTGNHSRAHIVYTPLAQITGLEHAIYKSKF